MVVTAYPTLGSYCFGTIYSVLHFMMLTVLSYANSITSIHSLLCCVYSKHQFEKQNFNVNKIFNVDINQHRKCINVVITACQFKSNPIWNTVNSAYNGSAYKELSVIRNWFSSPDLNPSLFYVKNMDIADSVIRNYRLEGTHFPVPMLISIDISFA